MSKEIYNSIFQQEIRDLIELKRALGFSYEAEAGSLRRIDTFLCRNALSEKYITKELCDLWCKKELMKPLRIRQAASVPCVFSADISMI